jgi:hypothetical protein
LPLHCGAYPCCGRIRWLLADATLNRRCRSPPMRLSDKTTRSSTARRAEAGTGIRARNPRGLCAQARSRSRCACGSHRATPTFQKVVGGCRRYLFVFLDNRAIPAKGSEQAIDRRRAGSLSFAENIDHQFNKHRFFAEKWSDALEAILNCPYLCTPLWRIGPAEASGPPPARHRAPNTGGVLLQTRAAHHMSTAADV